MNTQVHSRHICCSSDSSSKIQVPDQICASISLPRRQVKNGSIVCTDPRKQAGALSIIYTPPTATPSSPFQRCTRRNESHESAILAFVCPRYPDVVVRASLHPPFPTTSPTEGFRRPTRQNGRNAVACGDNYGGLMTRECTVLGWRWGIERNGKDDGKAG